MCTPSAFLYKPSTRVYDVFWPVSTTTRQCQWMSETRWFSSALRKLFQWMRTSPGSQVSGSGRKLDGEFLWNPPPEASQLDDKSFPVRKHLMRFFRGQNDHSSSQGTRFHSFLQIKFNFNFFLKTRQWSWSELLHGSGAWVGITIGSIARSGGREEMKLEIPVADGLTWPEVRRQNRNTGRSSRIRLTGSSWIFLSGGFLSRKTWFGECYSICWDVRATFTLVGWWQASFLWINWLNLKRILLNFIPFGSPLNVIS